MTERFNADEVFEIAEQIERNGAKFYRRAAELAPGEDARALLLGLAAMEDQHVSTFAAMHEELRKEKPDWLATPFDIDADDQAVLYLRAVAEGRISGQGGSNEAAYGPRLSVVAGLCGHD